MHMIHQNKYIYSESEQRPSVHLIHHVLTYCPPCDQVMSGEVQGQRGGVSGSRGGGCTRTKHAWLHKAVPAYSRARPKNSLPKIQCLRGVFPRFRHGTNCDTTMFFRHRKQERLIQVIVLFSLSLLPSSLSSRMDRKRHPPGHQCSIRMPLAWAIDQHGCPCVIQYGSPIEVSAVNCGKYWN